MHNKPLVYIDPDGRFAFALPICNFALSNCLGNTCIPGAMAHGAFDFAMSNVHAFEQGAMYIGCEDLDYGAKACLFDNLRQQQTERMDALGGFIMDAQGISRDDALYHSVRKGTTTGLEVASLATGAYSLGRGAYNLARGSASLAQTGLSTVELTNFGANRTFASNGGTRNSLALSSKSGADLITHLRYSEKYGKEGVKFLQNERIRYYGEITPPKAPGEMIGRRFVHEFNHLRGSSRGWMETLDSSSRIRQVRPQINPAYKTHYFF